jgi:two-component system, LytTR family, sensor kinase
VNSGVQEEQRNPLLKQRIIRGGAYLLGWTLVGLFFASQAYLTYKYSGGAAPWLFLVKFSLCEWYAWALLAFAIVPLARRFPLAHEKWMRNAALHFVAAVCVALLKWAIDNQVRHYVLGIAGAMSLAYRLHLNMLTYWAIVGVTNGYDYYRRYREGELRTSQLTAQLAQAQLQALRMQLHPHFLFNTLNAISTLVHRDPEAADRMIARLSDLLRLTLEDAGLQEVPLTKELDFLERYLDIERVRFADRLTVHVDVAPETLDAQVPYLILQPLVENAIRHGIAPCAAPGRVAICARRLNGMLQLEVRDDGPGFPPPGESNGRQGLGLSSTRARLEQIYGARHRFDLGNDAAGGAVATLTFPFIIVSREESSPSGSGEGSAT